MPKNIVNSLINMDYNALINLTKKENIDIVASQDVSILTEKSDKVGKISYDIELNKIKIPLKKQANVGILTIYEDGKKVDKINLTIKDNLEKANFLELYLRYLKSFIIGNIKF